MTAEGLVIDPSTTRYGPVGFAAAMLNILVLKFVTWLFSMADPGVSRLTGNTG
jgi:hypothetical protein